MASKDTFTDIEELKKKNILNEKLGLDDRDTKILSLVQGNPNISQEEIANAIKLSQPSVGARIRKLQQKGILHNVYGVNFKIADLSLGKVDVTTTDAEGIIDEFKNCPFFINGLITSGKYNLLLLFTATDLKRLEKMVNHHLRNNPKVKEVEFNIVISPAKDLILPINFCFDDKCDIKCQG